MGMVQFARIALCGALLAGCVGMAVAEDIDVKSLQEKIARQEALMGRLEEQVRNGHGSAAANASVQDCAESVVSLNKNATVNIGGFVYNKYEYANGKIDSIYHNGQDASQGTTDSIGRSRRAEINQSDMRISHARLTMKVDVNEHVDGMVHIDLQGSNDNRSDNCHRYWLRWKNICNSGFGIKVGRDDLIFGANYATGEYATAAKSGEGALRDFQWGTYKNNITNSSRLGMGNSGIMPAHNFWDNTRITQIAPYWEGMDGKLKIEASFFQHLSNNGGQGGRISNGRATQSQIYLDGHDYESRNYGFGSMSARVNFAPMEGLKLSASVMNFHDKNKDSDAHFTGTAQNPTGLVASTPSWKNQQAKNNTAVDFAVSYTPSFLNRLNVWAEYNHGWNVFNRKDVDAHTLSYGMSWKLTDKLKFFAQGDYISTTDKLQEVGQVFANDDKATYWAAYTGLRFAFPYGVVLEGGWKHEQTTWKQNVGLNNSSGLATDRVATRQTTLKGKTDMLYVHLGFTF